VDDCGEHGEKVSVVNSPYLLQNNVGDPFEVSRLFQSCVTHKPLLVGIEAPMLEIDAPLIDQSFQILLVGLFAFWLRFRQYFLSVGLYVLCKRLVEPSEGMANTIEFFLHDLSQCFQPLLNLSFV
jgi:hypothetical protein